ncbi:MAG: MFS transporter [Rhodoglobus sp.]|nr:MFS transporter [Rhodoglobus sp.]
MTPDTAASTIPRLTSRTWATVVVLGLVGQLAWTVENMYLNVFVYDTITDNPMVIATLVAASAVTATVATMLVGAASDRARRRREFIAGGYILWGVSTAAFGWVSVDAVTGMAPAANAVVLAIIAVVTLDCIMSFFGAGANDAAFNAWVTEATVPANRGRVDSVLAIMPLVAMLVVFGGFDGLTQAGQWREFFGIIGAVTAVVGVAAWILVRDSVITPSTDRYWASIVFGLRLSTVRANPRLYIVLLAYAVVGTCSQVFLPYLIIYIQRYLEIDGYAIVLGSVLIAASVLSVLGGRVIDRIGKTRMIMLAAGIFAAGLVLMFFARGMVPVIAAGIVMMTGFMLSIASVAATVRDYTPVDRVGMVQGLRMIFGIMIPMVVGPFVGAAVISGAGETFLELGVVKQVPTPWIFIAGAVVLVLVVPLARALRTPARAAP